MENPNSRGGRGGNYGRGRFNGRRPWGHFYARKQKNKTSEKGEDNDQNPPGPERGGSKSSKSRNSSRGHYGRKRAHGGSPNQEVRNGTRSDERDKNQPNPNKRPRNNIANIKSQIVSQWEKKMPGYLLYYSKSPPQIPGFENKFNAALEFLMSNGHGSKNKLVETEENEYFDLMYEFVVKNSSFNEKWPNFPDELIEEPQEVLNIWGLAMHKIVQESMIEDDAVLGNGNDPAAFSNGHPKKGDDVRAPRILCGIMKLEPVTPLMNIKSSLLGKFITIRGAVVRTGTIRPFSTTMTFLCKICERKFSIDQQDGRYSVPVRCGASNDCDNSNFFEPVEDAITTKVVESRRIRIQDMQSSEVERGSMPRTIDCELFNSFVGLCTAGNAVTVTGIVKRNKDVHHGGGEQSLHSLYLEVVAVRNHKDADRTMGGHWFSFSNKDYYAIKEIYDTNNLFRLLIASLCPSIYGHELVKAGLLLCLFGGTAQEEKVISRRSDINMLMVGDPGIGKSQMLKMTTELSPKGVYVCGTGSTIAGLTVTLVKEGDDYSLEAGALVMADKGVCCIDEFDKMQGQHNALLEAMEQQSISIAKSGVFRTIPARATVIAAANPVGGHYDKTKTVCENIKISAPLMSRFDLIFILLDTPDGDFDRKVVEHIMGPNKSRNCSFQSRSSASISDEPEQGYIPLMERMKRAVHEDVDIIPHRLIRKYIAYAKQYVKPKISTEAAAALKEYYLRLRVKHRLVDSTPVTNRQLESLVRLTEARAKIELREVATEADAKDVLEIYEASLCSAFDNELVAVSALSQSILVSTCGSKKSQANKANAKRLVSTLQRHAEQQCKNLFTVDEIKDISSALGLRSVVDSLIAALNNEGFLLNKGSRTYQLQSVDF